MKLDLEILSELLNDTPTTETLEELKQLKIRKEALRLVGAKSACTAERRVTPKGKPYLIRKLSVQ